MFDDYLPSFACIYVGESDTVKAVVCTLGVVLMYLPRASGKQLLLSIDALCIRHIYISV